MKSFFFVGVVIAMIAALMITTIGYASSDDQKFDDSNYLMGFEGTCTIFIENSAGQGFSAVVNLNDVTFEEGMMLAFGQGIRQASFAPLETAAITRASITKAADDYSIWARTTMNAEGFDIKKYDKVSMTCSGYAGDTQSSGNPDHATSSNMLCTSAKVTSVSVTLSDVAPKDDGGGVYSSNQFILDQSSSGEFSNCLNSAGGSLMNSNKLLGDQVDGATLHITVIGTVTLANGGSETASVDADLKISVTSWTPCSMSVALTSMSISG